MVTLPKEHVHLALFLSIYAPIFFYLIFLLNTHWNILIQILKIFFSSEKLPLFLWKPSFFLVPMLYFLKFLLNVSSVLSHDLHFYICSIELRENSKSNWDCQHLWTSSLLSLGFAWKWSFPQNDHVGHRMVSKNSLSLRKLKIMLSW